MNRRIFSLAFTAFLLCGICFAQEHTDREAVEKDPNLKRDFAIQGEYLLESIYTSESGIDPVDDPELAGKLGIQIIAMGDGKFEGTIYKGGLPGEGWNKMLDKTKFKGKLTTDSTLEIESPREKLKALFVFKGDKLDMWGNTGEGTFIFKKVERKSETLGKKAPEGAKVIFDGTNLDNFNDKAKMNEKDKTLWAEAWVKPFEKDKPYTLHIEFMTSYMPQARGQGRSNSGVYIFEAYECQVLDSFGLEGENNECGGFYQVKKPDVNMCFPPLTWQSYDFDFTPPKFEDGKKVANSKLTVKHNGVVIHEDMEFKKETPGCKGEADEARGVYLQGHGNKVQYRNIWIKYND